MIFTRLNDIVGFGKTWKIFNLYVFLNYFLKIMKIMLNIPVEFWIFYLLL